MTRLILTELSIGCLAWGWTVTGSRINLAEQCTGWLHVAELSTGWLDPYIFVQFFWFCNSLIFLKFFFPIEKKVHAHSWSMLFVLKVAELHTRWLNLSWTSNRVYVLIGWFYCSWAIFLVMLLLEYYVKCTIRVTVLLVFDCTFLNAVTLFWFSIQFLLPLLRAFKMAI